MRKLLLILFLVYYSYSYAEECPDAFKYKQTILLSLPEDAESTGDMVVAIPFNTKALIAEGKLRNDGNDLVVTDSKCTPLPFYIQGFNERDSNVLYIKIPQITGDDYEVLVHYGNHTMESSSADGASVFAFFDDFEDGIMDWDKWETVGLYTSAEESDGNLNFTGAFGHGGMFLYIAPKFSVSTPVTFDFVAKASNSHIYGIADTGDIDRIAFRYASGSRSYDTLDIIANFNDTVNGGFSDGKFYPGVKTPKNVMNQMSISSFIDQDKKLNVTRVMNYTTGHGIRDTYKVVLNNITYDVMRPFFASFGSATNVEFIGIRNTPEFEPVISYGEEVDLATKIMLNQVNRITIYPNPASQEITFPTLDFIPDYIEFLDVSGKIIDRLPYSRKIDISHFKSGTFIIRLHSDHHMVSTLLYVTGR